MPTAVQVRGLRELQEAFARADRATRLGFRTDLRAIAKPVAIDATDRAAHEISGTHRARTVDWTLMRVGMTRDLVYVAPRQRGVKTRNIYDPRRRGYGTGPPSFADLLMDKAMEPALEAHEEQIVAEFDHVLDGVAARFNEGGPL